MKPITGNDDKRDSGGLFTNRRRRKERRSGSERSSTREGGRLAWLDGRLSGSSARGVLAALGGLGIGYLIATLFMFPVPKAPDDLVQVPDMRGMSDGDAILAIADAGLILGTIDSLLLPSEPAGTVIGQSPLAGQLGTDSTQVRLTVSAGAHQLPVPGVVGLPLARALDLLDAAGFEYQVDTIESDEGSGTVVSSSPPVGERLTLPSTVSLEVSEGVPAVQVPRLVGLEEEHALALIDSLGLAVGEVEVQFRFGLDQGKIVQQEPAPGVDVEPGSSIRLVVGRRGGEDT